jgi:spermidine synthase
MQHLKDDGIVILRNFFTEDEITNLLESTKNVFKIQFEHFGYRDYHTDDGFKESIGFNRII